MLTRSKKLFQFSPISLCAAPYVSTRLLQWPKCVYHVHCFTLKVRWRMRHILTHALIIEYCSQTNSWVEPLIGATFTRYEFWSLSINSYECVLMATVLRRACVLLWYSIELAYVHYHIYIVELYVVIALSIQRLSHCWRYLLDKYILKDENHMGQFSIASKY